MLLISIDTSGRSGSVALCQGDQNSFEVLQLAALQGGTYSARLMPAIAEILIQQHVSKEQIDAFVVVSGPGSFTGLRVGIATVKGLCEVLHKPLVAVSMLEAVALKGHGFSRAEGDWKNAPLDAAEKFIRAKETADPSPLKGFGMTKVKGFSAPFGSAEGRLSKSCPDTQQAEPSPDTQQPETSPDTKQPEPSFSAAFSAAVGQITVALDAGRSEVYVGEFVVENSQISVTREYMTKLEVFAAEVTAAGISVLAPDSKVAEALSALGATVQEVDAVHAGEIGRIGLLKLLRGELADAATLDANYIRRSDAEIFSTPKH